MAMILTDILPPAELAALQAELAVADWIDGSATAGGQAAGVKANHQLAADDPVTVRWAAAIGNALGPHQGFMSGALPARITVPMFSRYGPGESYGLHIDNAVRFDGRERLRTDLAATIFLADPASYDGGELIVETSFGATSIKLAAGQVLLYPAASRHRVAPVTRGYRYAAILWVQSMVRDDTRRQMLIELDRSIQSLRAEIGPGHAQLVSLTGTYHNLLRCWAEV